MKRMFLLPVAAILFTGSALLLNGQAKQVEPKPVVLVLTQNEAQVIYQLIDDAAVAGTIRKPLLQKIEVAFQESLPKPPKDSTKKK